MTFEAIIGLEIHVQMKTKSKMFSSAPNVFSKSPNSEVGLFDMAYPGTMPVVNKQAVRNGIRIANALHMEIERTLCFDRKNYFYSDLPKGYQITQQFHPIGRNGYLDIVDRDGNKKRIHIERAHLEEDSCKSLHLSDCTLLDYNRAGVPLIEIVSSPEIRSGTEAMHYVEAIRNIAVYSLISDGKMEEGSLRCDVNISLKPVGSDVYGTKVEIKNINTLKNIEAALDYEIERQTELLLSGALVPPETRRFEEASGKTVLMRAKTAPIDYKYFPDPNIAPICLSEEFIEEAIRSCPELYESKKERYQAMGLSKMDAERILSDLATSAFFEEGVVEATKAKTFANFLIVEVNEYLNKNEMKIGDFPISPKKLAKLTNLQEEGFTHRQCVDILNSLLLNPSASVEEARKEKGIEKTVQDDALVLTLVTEVLNANPQSINDYKAGNGRAIGFLIGQVMKNAKGKVNPADASRIMKEEIEKR